ncbi:MAG TPA: response regulator transcription factor [Candidatus Acidoferrales bacterium]|nr:response regulator transcription factor [Candidatus Acidoferrales bacterium]
MSADSKLPPAKSSKRRLFLVDDHPVTREGLARIINLQRDMVLCGSASTATEALDQIAEVKPDLVIVDLAMAQGPSGLHLISKLAAQPRRLPMLVLSTLDESLYAERALRAGAKGYVMKHEPIAVVLEAMRKVLAGEVHLSKKMKDRMLYKMVKPHASPWTETDLLSHREIEVYRLIGEGRRTRDIAAELNLSVSTIETYRAHIKEKLDLPNASELARHAVQWVHEQSW